MGEKVESVGDDDHFLFFTTYGVGMENATEEPVVNWPRCGVCLRAIYGNEAALAGSLISPVGKGEAHYRVKLCKTCFKHALDLLRQQYILNTMFDDYEEHFHRETFGLIFNSDAQG